VAGGAWVGSDSNLGIDFFLKLQQRVKFVREGYMNKMSHSRQVPQNDAVLENLQGDERMNKHFLTVAMTVVAVSAVLAIACTTASLGATAAATATTLTVSVSKTDVYAGDSVTGSGKLVDANGNGIPNQVIHIQYQVTAPSKTFSGQKDITTDASGNFGETMTVPSSSSFSQATITLTAVYSGNAQYAASQSAPVTITAHLS
jgi:hypothetical protein